MSDARPIRLAVISSGLSVPSSTRMLADRLASATRDVLESYGRAVTTDVIEVKDLAHDIVDATLTHFANERLQKAIDLVKAADGVIAVTPIFNLSYAGLFKSFIDVIDEGAFAGVPVLLGATGGTARHSLAIDYTLRPLFTYLKATPLPTSVFAASEDFGSPTTAPHTTPLTTRTHTAATALAHSLLPTPSPSPTPTPTPKDNFTNFTPMTHLLPPPP
ncbi:CE1759 family FMN reductase [Actinocorallia sp. A-T 12471]|uniref:CE1759 family FMN reductase n=1 Tax=Actinocorallia sp. A-T 12471 TaxID=3089813 RepID=UPI0029D07392|nr:CE1759 family FMN reductase [Actinocorallia sp. A-T 12471]MDX6743149.1 NAD(P)H-dependent oxidoreductase [Actinocorallia sp. A-T 12471]